VGSFSFDPIAARYDATRGGEARGRFVAEVLDPWLPADGPVVEIGVGTGVVAMAVAATGRIVFWVLHLVGDLPAVVAECHRTLRSGGRLLGVVADESRRVGEPAVVDLEHRYRRRADEVDNLDPLVTAAGFRRIHVEPITPFDRPMTPREVADHLEQRTWAWTWKVPPEMWPTELEPVIAELRARPDADRPRPQQVANLLAVWER
jgi:SAM-dependent methyltransferase